MFLQLNHLRYFIFFRFSMGLVDNIIAKCRQLAYSLVFFFNQLTKFSVYHFEEDLSVHFCVWRSSNIKKFVVKCSKAPVSHSIVFYSCSSAHKPLNISGRFPGQAHPDSYLLILHFQLWSQATGNAHWSPHAPKHQFTYGSKVIVNIIIELTEIYVEVTCKATSASPHY